MEVQSNIKAVIGRIERLKTRDIPQALATALKPAQWRQLAREEAEKTLQAIAEPPQRQFIPQFIRTLDAEAFGEMGFLLRLSSPFTEAQTLADFQAARSAVKPSDLGQNLFAKDVTAFEELMTEWVEKEKKKKRRDLGKSDESIGHFISHIMLTPNPTPGEDRARQKLMPHIVDFLNRKEGMDRLAPEIVDMWLRAVLCAWRNLVGHHFPQFFKTALRDATTSLPL